MQVGLGDEVVVPVREGVRDPVTVGVGEGGGSKALPPSQRAG